MNKIHIRSLFQCSSFLADHIPNHSDHLARRIPGLGVSILERGAIYWGSDSRQIIIEAPACFWVWEGKFCRYGSIPGRIWDNAYAHIVGEVAQEIVNSGLFPPSDTPFVKLPVGSPVFSWFHEMLEAHRADPIRNRDQCLWYIIGIGLELKKYMEVPEYADSLSRELMALKRKIFAAPLAHYDFAEMARRNRISEKHFARRFAEVNGLTPHNTIIHAKLQLAMELLLKKYSVKETALAAGFNSASYFSRLFKKYYCLPPNQMIQTDNTTDEHQVTSRTL